MAEIFSPFRLGPVTLRNRTIRSAAFEGMCPGNSPSEELLNYHTAVGRGGIGMTTVAYAAVCKSGLSFERQLWMRKEIVPQLKELTDAIHRTGAKASIQLGHCGNMSHRRICGCTPLGASSGFNVYSPTRVRGMKQKDIDEVVEAFGNAVSLAIEAGFDCVEIHAGHGYLISQFLSPFTNHRKDAYGGSQERRMRFMNECVSRSVAAATGKDGKRKIAVIAKMNTRDGFRGGMEVDDCIRVAAQLQRLGVDGIVLSGGFVSKAPMYVMRGEFPVRAIAHYMPWKTQWWLKIGVILGGRLLSPSVPFKPLFFLEDALKFKKVLPDMTFIYVGGVTSRAYAQRVIDEGFPLFQMGRAVLEDTDFVNKMASDTSHCSGCEHTNFCIGRMYTLSMACHKNCPDITPALERACRRVIKRGL